MTFVIWSDKGTGGISIWGAGISYIQGVEKLEPYYFHTRQSFIGGGSTRSFCEKRVLKGTSITMQISNPKTVYNFPNNIWSYKTSQPIICIPCIQSAWQISQLKFSRVLHLTLYKFDSTRYRYLSCYVSCIMQKHQHWSKNYPIHNICDEALEKQPKRNSNNHNHINW